MKALRYMIIATFCIALLQPSASIAQNNEAKPLEARSCKNAKDIGGLWKLTALYENPVGPVTQQREQNPYQYMIFEKNGLFHESKKNKDYKRIRQAIRQTRKASKDVWQYLVGEQGLIYYYKNQVFSHSVYCAIVTNSSPGYRKGSMILTPTDAGGGQVFQIYQKVKRKRRK